MKKHQVAWVMGVVLSFCLGQAALAVNCFWKHGGSDDLWSNTNNWKNGVAPGSNDTAWLAVDCPDAPQTIVLDTNVWLNSLQCTATNNRAYTINATNGAVITFVGDTDITGVRTVPLTINADIRYVFSFSVQRRGQPITLNGSITEASGTPGTFIINDTGTLTLGGSNAFTYIKEGTGPGELVIRHPYAFGDGYYHNIVAGSTLSLATNTLLVGISANALYAQSNMNLRIYGAGVSNVTLTVKNNITKAPGVITVLPPGGGGAGHLTIFLWKDGAANTAAWNLHKDSSIYLTNNVTRISWGAPCTTTGEGSFTTIGAGGVYVYSTNTYSGGTYILGGRLWTVGNDLLYTNGAVTIRSPGIMDLHGYTSHVAVLTGNGTVDMDDTGLPGAIIVTGTFAPGSDGAGSMTCTAVSASSDFILGSASTSLFELNALAGNSDKVVFASNKGNLTLAGTLKVENLGGLQEGAYKLFDLAGGAISGNYTAISMPPGFSGTVDKSSGDVVLNVTKGSPGGAVLIVR